MATQGLLGSFTFDEEIERFPPDGRSGRRSETLVKTAGLRVVLVTMRAGTELREHSAPGTITVQPLRGRFALEVGGEEHEVSEGTIVALEGAARHAVRAVEDGAFLLTMACREEIAPRAQRPRSLAMLKPLGDS